MTTHQEFESSHSEQFPQLYRVSQQHTQQAQKRPFVERPFVDFAILVTCPLSLWLVVAAFVPAVDFGSLAAWLGNGAIILGVPLFALSLIAIGWRLRWRINNHQPWWNDACPTCSSEALKRKRRRDFDRLICRLGIPVRRYICADCRWEGNLIDHRRVF